MNDKDIDSEVAFYLDATYQKNLHQKDHLNHSKKKHKGGRGRWSPDWYLAGKTQQRYYNRDISEDIVPAKFKPIKLNQRKSDKIFN